MFMLLVKVDSVLKTNNNHTICTYFSLSMVTDQPVSPENDHFKPETLYLHILYSDFFK